MAKGDRRTSEHMTARAVYHIKWLDMTDLAVSHLNQQDAKAPDVGTLIVPDLLIGVHHLLPTESPPCLFSRWSGAGKMKQSSCLSLVIRSVLYMNAASRNR